ncbi:MAG: hypothetical protein EBV23_01495 [Flavobacteriia bacterium]|nr:hypothetical protein [Flavobacteriia bacterium]
MSDSNSNIAYLEKEIDRFLNKFYLNQSIRGLLIFLALLFFSYLMFSSLAYFLDLHQWVRLFFLCFFLCSNIYVLFRWFFYPLLQSKGVINRKSHLEASFLIGQMFPEIADRLTNTLQLHREQSDFDNSNELLLASIAQKTDQLKIFRFTEAIDFSVNRKYLKYVLPSLFTLILLLVFIPAILTQGSYRIVRFDKEFLPFSFSLKAGECTVEEGTDIPVSVSLKGERLPDKVYLVTDQGKFLMNRSLKNRFDFTLIKVNTSGKFYFEANGYQSKSFEYHVTGKSVLGKITLQAIYPSYLSKKNEIIQNAADITVPEGTQLTWSGGATNVKALKIKCFGNTHRFNSEHFKLAHKVRNSGDLALFLINKFNNRLDSTKFRINVVKDTYPQILLNEQSDSIQEGVKYFNGQISDDYGLSSLKFMYKIIRKGKEVKSAVLPVGFTPGSKSAFTFAVDFRRESVQLEDKIEYFFTVFDNDGVNGHKSTRSFIGQYALPDLQELNKEREADQAKTSKDIEKAIEKTKAFERSVDKLKKDLNNSKSKDWNNKQQIQQLKEEQKALSSELERIKEQLEQSTQDKNQLSEIDKELLEKQEMIQKLLEEVMDDELKKLLEEIEKMFNERADMELKKEVDKLDQSSENMTKQLDRTLEMLKKLQVNERIDDIEKELKETAKLQEELRKEMDEKSLSKEELLKKQDEINQQFDSIQKKLENTKELNKELMDPLNLENTKELEQSIDNQLNNAKEDLGNNKKSKAKDAQKQAGDQMEQLAEQLNQQQQASNQQQAEEDMEMLRQILESLMVLSFDQESLIEEFNRINFSDPKYRKLGREQLRINRETGTVRDSLLALAKRQPKVASFIDKELNDISFSQESAIEAIDDHRKQDIVSNEQQVMTAYNNLALLLNEALQQMQAQAQSSMPSNGSCSKPGSGKPKPGSISTGDMKEMLKKQLERMQKGQSPGGDKPGDKEGNSPGMKPGTQGMNMLGLGNKEIAKMAAEQTAIRQKLEQLKNELNKDGKGSGNQLNPLLKELEEQERELINQRIDKDMVKRQQDILTRLLESEKAIMERGYEEKRESKSGKDQNTSNLIELKEYKKQSVKQVEMINVVDPSFNQYFRSKAESYFNMVQ